MTTTTDPTNPRTRAARLRLHGLLAHWQDAVSAGWAQTLIEWEEAERARRSHERRLAEARIGRFKPLCDFDWSWPTRCDRQAVEALMGLDFIRDAGNAVLIGPNGVGKSTFINILQGEEQADSGKVNIGDTVIFGNYSQQGLVLKEDMRVIEFVKSIAESFPLASGGSLSAAQFLQLFLFDPDKQYTYINSLSGGEKRRLHLLSILFKSPNFLVLDEPTNDLDLPTLGVLENFLSEFPGCLLIVSHDRYFMDRLVDHLFVFEGDGAIRDDVHRNGDNRDATSSDNALPGLSRPCRS